jgi:hypothetical protein
MRISFEVAHHCPGNEEAARGFVFCLVAWVEKTGNLEVDWLIRTEVKALDDVVLTDGAHLESFSSDDESIDVCPYCNLQFATVRQWFADNAHRFRGKSERAAWAALIAKETVLSREDIAEMVQWF